MGILCHPWCFIYVFSHCSLLSPLCLPVPDAGPGSSWAAVPAALGSLVQWVSWPLHFGFRVSWKRRRKISSLKHGCPSQGTALAACCEGCPLPILFFFIFFFSLCHFAFFFFFPDLFWEGSRRRNKKWLMKYRGRRLHMQIHRVPSGFPSTWASLQTNLQNSPVQT